MRIGTLQARPSDLLTSPLADCMLRMIVGSYIKARSMQTFSDIAMICEPGSRMDSTCCWWLTSGKIDRRAEDSFATMSRSGTAPSGSDLRYVSYGSGTMSEPGGGVAI